jgi:hypothetical protein
MTLRVGFIKAVLGEGRGVPLIPASGTPFGCRVPGPARSWRERQGAIAVPAAGAILARGRSSEVALARRPAASLTAGDRGSTRRPSPSPPCRRNTRLGSSENAPDPWSKPRPARSPPAHTPWQDVPALRAFVASGRDRGFRQVVTSTTVRPAAGLLRQLVGPTGARGRTARLRPPDAKRSGMVETGLTHRLTITSRHRHPQRAVGSRPCRGEDKQACEAPDRRRSNTSLTWANGS